MYGWWWWWWWPGPDVRQTVFSRPGVQQSFWGGGVFNGWWASKVGESDGGGRGEIGLFFAFLFVGDIIISIQKRGEGESQEREREREEEKKR